METEENERILMVKNQIESRGICDLTLLSVLEKVPRHLFIPPEVRPLAYSDRALPSYGGQTISQPYIVAKMTELLKLEKHHKVLEIGTGTGYQTAVLAELAGEVYTIEIDPIIYKQAQINLSPFNYKNIHFILGDGSEGCLSAAPFDAIIVTAAAADFPETLFDQLAKGGKMTIPIGTYLQILYLITKDMNGVINKTNIFQVQFVRMK